MPYQWWIGLHVLYILLIDKWLTYTTQLYYKVMYIPMLVEANNVLINNVDCQHPLHAVFRKNWMYFMLLLPLFAIASYAI